MVPSVGDQTRPRPWGVDLMLLTALAQASSPTRPQLLVLAPLELPQTPLLPGFFLN